MLIIGQPDKMLRDLRNIKEAQSYLLRQCGFRSVVIIMFRILCFQTICWSNWPRYEIQQGHSFIAPPSNTWCRDKHTLKACHTAASHSFQVFSTLTSLVLYHTWLCRNILKPTLQFFLHSGHFNCTFTITR